MASIIDITERKQAEAALRESQERLALAQKAARIGVWDCHLSTNLGANITNFSGEHARLYGLHPDHPPLTHEEWLQLVHPSDRERVEMLLAHRQRWRGPAARSIATTSGTGSARTPTI